jgi:hypothetical protein
MRIWDWDSDADPGSEVFLALDPGSGTEKFGSGLQDKHPGSQHWAGYKIS